MRVSLTRCKTPFGDTVSGKDSRLTVPREVSHAMPSGNRLKVTGGVPPGGESEAEAMEMHDEQQQEEESESRARVTAGGNGSSLSGVAAMASKAVTFGGEQRWEYNVDELDPMEKLLAKVERKAMAERLEDWVRIVHWARQGAIKGEVLCKDPDYNVVEACGRHRFWDEKASLCEAIHQWSKAAGRDDVEVIERMVKLADRLMERSGEEQDHVEAVVCGVVIPL